MPSTAPRTGETDVIDMDETLSALAKTIADLTFGSDVAARQRGQGRPDARHCRVRGGVREGAGRAFALGSPGSASNGSSGYIVGLGIGARCDIIENERNR